MAYNKDNYENNRLTPKQEKFCQEIASGKSQRQAYLSAYPTSKNWQENTIDSRASVLMKNKKVIKRLDEIRDSMNHKIVWNRTRALKEINYVLEMNKRDIERINDACQTEIDLLEAKLLQKGQEMADAKTPREMVKIAQEMQDMTETIARLKKRARVNPSNVHGILEASKILNRMYGLDITKVEIKESDTTREEAKQLSIEELKALAYANRNIRESNESN